MNIEFDNNKKFDLMIPSSLSWIRLVAVILVFAGHSKIHLGGGQGAIFFLVISGYTFTRYFLKEWEQSAIINFARFYNKRFWKIIPALYAVVLFNVLIKYYFDKPIDFHHVLSVITFSSNYYNALHGHPNTGFAHFWTTSMLIQFYLLWPVVFQYFMRKFSTRNGLSWFLISVVIMVIVYRTILSIFHLSSESYIYNSFETRLDALAIGALLALNIDLDFFKKKLSFFEHFKFLQLSFTLLLIALVGFFPIALRDSIGFSLHAFLICIFIIQLTKLTDTPYRTNLLSNVYLSSISYWFYLIHPWGIAIGEHFHTNKINQVIIGGLIILIFTSFIFLIKERFSHKFNWVLNQPSFRKFYLKNQF
ncbi:MAG: acyltransferase [Bacteriovorax sp.]|nr:acyltransferase [Bacteriovorax sp.]